MSNKKESNENKYSKDMFTFVNDIESDIEISDDIENDSESFENDESKFPGISNEERFRRIKIVKTIILFYAISLALFIFVLVWQDDTSLLGIVDALWLVVVMEFFIGWILLMNNKTIFAPLVYGAKSFAKMLVGKAMEDDYYTYAKMKEDSPVDNMYYRICFIGALINAIPATILLIIVL